MSSPGHRTQLQLTEERRQRLLDRLDGPRSAPPAASLRANANRRSERRWSYRTAELAIIVEHPGGGISRLLVCPRNLSGGGIAFLHGGFLHPGSKCWVNVPRRHAPDGSDAREQRGAENETLRGRIVSCRHIEGLAHEVGVQFNERIDVAQFLDAAEVGRDDAISVELPTIRGRLLCLEPSRADAALIEHLLKPTGIDLEMHLIADGVIDQAARGACDAIVTELLDQPNAVDLVKAIRETAFLGPIALLTAETSEERIRPVVEAGADTIMSKPFVGRELIDFINGLMATAARTAAQTCFFSEMEQAPGMLPLIEGFIAEARETAEKLEPTLSADEREVARRMVLRLKGSAASYGFSALSESAQGIIDAIDAAEHLQSCTAQTRRLIAMCNRLRIRAAGAHDQQEFSTPHAPQRQAQESPKDDPEGSAS